MAVISKSRLRGQAMTEFLICAAFVLLPLFLGLAYLAKYIDINHAAIQAARYEAWEYTVWYAQDSEKMTGFSVDVTQPVKSITRTQDETRLRFYSDPFSETGTLPIRDDDADTGWTQGNRNRMWTDHSGQAMYDFTTDGDGAQASLQSSTDTPTIPVVGDIMNLLFDIVDFAFSAIGSLMGLIGSTVGFTAINTDGYAVATTSLNVASSPQFIGTTGNLSGTSNVNITGLNPGNLVFSRSAAVLSDGWNAGGVEHTYNQVGGTVPTVILKELLTLPGLAQIWDVIAILAPELRRCHPDIPALPPFGNPDFPDDKGSLWLGHIDIDAVHPDRLSGGGSHVCDDAGICTFVPNIPRDAASRDCIE